MTLPSADRATRLLLGLCFFASGAAGLVYEVLWSRHLQRFFGSSTEAVSVVLAVFMLGLGLGGHFLGRRIDRSPSPMRLYALLEIGIGLYAFATPLVLAAAQGAWAAAAGRVELGAAASVALKVVLAMGVLAVPAFLMGGTFPALVRAVSDDRAGAQRLIGLFYALNTAGAVLGTLATGFVFLELLGEKRSLLLCGVVNAGIGVLLLARDRRRGHPAPEADEPSPEAGVLSSLASSRTGRYVLLGLLVSGLTTMLYEIVFVRILGLVFGVSTYAFSIVLAVFLLGLAGGALLCSGLTRFRAPRVLDFAVSQLVVSLFATVALFFIPSVPLAVAILRQIPELGFWQILGGKAVLAALFVFPLALAAGVSVPLLMSALAEDVRDLGRQIGDAYLVNTVGTVTGSLAAGFLLVPLLGTERTLRVGAFVPAATALAGYLLLGSGRRLGAFVAVILAVVGLAAPRWSPRLFLSSDAAGAQAAFATRLELESAVTLSPLELVFLKEGRNAAVAVTRTPGARSLLVNGHADASDGPDMSTQLLLGVIPALAHPHPRNVFVVGFGSGVTADAAARCPDVEHVDVAELERAVVTSAPWFRHVNHDVASSPKVRFLYDDARSVLVATPRRYDLILSEPSNPWRAGIANLFTADFFAAAKRTLNKGGVFAQWLQLYQLDFASVEMILRTFSRSFRHTQVW
ncbi:MAG TPA: fused MFS/spermidine synthase, partial [Thermoanaerobaculia bacterium]|nr:fused MFS/spermidine synthase [Thermoanaerobaculia bacterium]